ncbi:MAG TPA: hypothetical protein VN715_03640 [Roseiarcus sp.]|nr:hypothetical protein [Roseiarcus sp.]
MTRLSQSQTHTPRVGPPPARPSAQRPSQLLAGIYHDIGMAAVALGLELAMDSLEPEAHEAVRRGNRYIHLMPRRQETPAAAAT